MRALATLLGTGRAATGADSRSAVGPESSVRSAFQGSIAARAVRRLETGLEAASRYSTLTSLVGTATEYVHDAWLYRWLTAEPDPDVVVIDLRQTWSVGPPLAVLDRVVDAIVPGLERASAVRAAEHVADVVRRRPIAIASALGIGALASSLLVSLVAGDPSRRLLAVQIAVAAVLALGLRSRTTLDDLRTTRTARLLVAVLEPPDPPSEDDVSSPGTVRSEDAEGSATEFGDAESDRERADGAREERVDDTSKASADGADGEDGEPADGTGRESTDGTSGEPAEKTPDEDDERGPR